MWLSRIFFLVLYWRRGPESGFSRYGNDGENLTNVYFSLIYRDRSRKAIPREALVFFPQKGPCRTKTQRGLDSSWLNGKNITQEPYPPPMDLSLVTCGGGESGAENIISQGATEDRLEDHGFRLLEVVSIFRKGKSLFFKGVYGGLRLVHAAPLR